MFNTCATGLDWVATRGGGVDWTPQNKRPHQQDMDPYSKWEEIEREKRAHVPALYDPTAAPSATNSRGLEGGGCQVLRVRQEYNGRDAINSRSWDFFHATPPTQINERGLQTTNAPVYMDMNPICSRTNTVQYRLQPAYIPDPPRGATTADSLGVPPPASAAAAPPPDRFSVNPYTQRLNAGGQDARNMMRELRGAVVEDNRERSVDAARALAARQFTDRWLPARTATDLASLQAYDLLRPKRGDEDDF
jgi:hypothetical protein